jgi:hypothetical protein
MGTFRATVELVAKNTPFVPPERLKVVPPVAFRKSADVF